MAKELIRLHQIIISNLDKILHNAIDLENLVALHTREGWKSVQPHLNFLLDNTNDLIIKTSEAMKHIKNISGLNETEQKQKQSLIENLNRAHLDTLQRFTVAQYSAGSLLTRINDTSSIVPKRELVSTERIEVKKRNPEPIRVPGKQNDQLKYDRKIYSNRKDQVISRDIHTAPIRSLNDFLFDATWNVPRYDDEARIQNRIISNLIYYQTNYFIFGIACVLLLGIMFPVDFLIILSLVLSLVKLGNDSSSASRHQANRNVSSIRQRHSSTSRQGLLALAFFILLGVAFYKLSLLNILFILLFGILLPILAIMFHAILRKRSLANKLSNQIGRVRSHTTPMTILLEKFELDELSGLE